MKRIFQIKLMLFIAFTLTAQVPEMMNYQAVIRNASGELIINKPVGVFIVLQKKSGGSTLPVTIYMEKHSATTNANGLITLQIGAGTPSFPYHALSFSQIKWEDGNVHLIASIDPTGGTNYTITSESQLLSVPYALYAKSAGKKAETAVLGEIKYFNGTEWVTVTPDIDGKVLTLENQIPVWKNPFSDGTVIGEMKYWTGAKWLSIPPSLENKYLTIENNQPVWKDFVKTIDLPTLTTKAATNINIVSATCGGTILTNGGGVVMERGICYSSSSNAPTINDKVISCGSGVGTFSANVTGLLPNRSYWVRSYAINEKGIVYGEYIHFQTPSIEIGSDFQGGKLLHIFMPGEPGYVAGEIHGLVMAPYDQSFRILACPENGEWAAGTHLASAIGLGKINTNLIATKFGTSANIAAVVCYNLDLNGYNDWFLPSIDELELMILEKSKLGNFPADIYWSSTDDDMPTPGTGVYIDRGAYCVKMSTGATSKENKDNRNAGVRAFRSF